MRVKITTNSSSFNTLEVSCNGRSLLSQMALNWLFVFRPKRAYTQQISRDKDGSAMSVGKPTQSQIAFFLSDEEVVVYQDLESVYREN